MDSERISESVRHGITIHSRLTNIVHTVVQFQDIERQNIYSFNARIGLIHWNYIIRDDGVRHCQPS